MFLTKLKNEEDFQPVDTKTEGSIKKENMNFFGKMVKRQLWHFLVLTQA